MAKKDKDTKEATPTQTATERKAELEARAARDTIALGMLHIEVAYTALQAFAGGDVTVDEKVALQDLRDAVYDACIAAGIRALKVWDREEPAPKPEDILAKAKE